MLDDPTLKRTMQCNKYDDLLKEKEHLFSLFDIEIIKGTELRSKLMVNCLERPIMTKDTVDIGIRLPLVKILRDIVDKIGYDLPINIIDVTKQNEIRDRTLTEYIDYIENRTAEHKTLNLISLELSRTTLNCTILAPNIVREIDWVDLFYPLEKRSRGDYPQVQKYCLIGMKSSYTDFHVDFGGTSVWYHVLSGHKRFYLVAPTAENLNMYEHWIRSTKQSETFFGDLLGEGQCKMVDLLPGQTLFIPAGCIHSVYTFEDSLVFGGNFLNSYSILRQLQVYGIETRSSVHKIYRFPYFKELNFYFLSNLLAHYKSQSKGQNKRVIDDDEKDQDSDDDDESTKNITLTSAVIFQQLPYLIKACESWVNSSETSDIRFFTQATAKLTYHSPMDFINDWWATILLVAEGDDSKNHIESIRRSDDLFESIRSIEIQNGKLIQQKDLKLEIFDIKRDHNIINESDQLMARTVTSESNKKVNKSVKTRNRNLSTTFLKNYDNEADDVNDNDFDIENEMMDEDEIIDGGEEDFDEDFEDDYEKKTKKKRTLPPSQADIRKEPIKSNTSKSNKSSTNARKFLLSKIGMK
jgi:hypothetical protein